VIPARDVALITGLTMRLTRLVVSDDLGQWWLKDPLDRWLHAHPPSSPWEDAERSGPLEDMRRVAGGESHRMRWARYAEGADCPHCVSFHAAYLSLGSYLLARRLHLLPAWRFAAGTMSLSAVVGHVSARID
jgi:hypothetical protein